MRILTITVSALLWASSLAQTISVEYIVDQSADFNLVVQSSNKTLNGKLLSACHIGAAHESLCIIPVPTNFTEKYNIFQFNSTRAVCTETNSTGTFIYDCSFQPTDPALVLGSITWWYYYTFGSSLGRSPQAVYMDFNAASNVVQMQIGDFYDKLVPEQIAFDKKGLMNIPAYMDDRLEPNYELLDTPQILYRWYICLTYWSVYHYYTLNWVAGAHSPQNPTCQKVDIKRVFI